MNAVHFQGIFGIGLAVGLGLLFQSQGQPLGGPLTVYVWIGYALGLLFAAMYVAGQPRGHRLLLPRAAVRVLPDQAPRRPDPRHRCC